MTKKAKPSAKPVKEPSTYILVGRNLFARCDSEDFAMLSKMKWHAHKGKAGVVYARSYISSMQRKRVFMHALLRGKGCDHINGNGLDNRKSNLRRCTVQENGWNRQSRRGSSKYKGVHWDGRKKKWCASITRNGKQHHLSYCMSQEDAAIYYDVAAQMLFGHFARLNFPVTISPISDEK